MKKAFKWAAGIAVAFIAIPIVIAIFADSPEDTSSGVTTEGSGKATADFSATATPRPVLRVTATPRPSATVSVLGYLERLGELLDEGVRLTSWVTSLSGEGDVYSEVWRGEVKYVKTEAVALKRKSDALKPPQGFSEVQQATNEAFGHLVTAMNYFDDGVEELVYGSESQGLQLILKAADEMDEVANDMDRGNRLINAK